MLQIKGCEIEIIRGDMTTLKVDAIVNAANNVLQMGGGVAGVIRERGGAQIEHEAMAQGPIAIGAAVTTKAGRLPCRYIIHAATMGMDFQTDEHKIRAAAASALAAADQFQISSVAFPALGCGVGRFPLIGAAKIMAQEILKFAKEQKQTSVKKIILCLYDKKAYDVFCQTVTGYITHFKDNLGDGPYATVDILIEYGDGLIIIERSNPPYGFALPGGFVDYGESLETAAQREAKEETNLDLVDLRQFRAYSDPRRDPRFHTISMAFIARGEGTPCSGDDAKGLQIVSYARLLDQKYAFDHHKIIEDYLALKKQNR